MIALLVGLAAAALTYTATTLIAHMIEQERNNRLAARIDAVSMPPKGRTR